MSIAPFGAPVVPDVKTSWARSSGAGGGRGRSSAMPASTSAGHSSNGMISPSVGRFRSSETRTLARSLPRCSVMQNATTVPGSREDVLDLAGAQHWVHRYQHETRHCGGERQQVRLRGARRQDSNPVTRREARRERASHGFRLGNCLRVGPPYACRRFCGTRYDGGAVRSSRRGVPQDAGDRRVEDRLARIGRPP